MSIIVLKVSYYPFVSMLREDISEIAKLNAVSRLWTARKLYGGNIGGMGGILPPTDPRLVDLTDEQIELDIALYLQDHPELKKKAEAYQDSEYERAMKEELAELPEDFQMPSDFVEVPFDED